MTSRSALACAVVLALLASASRGNAQVPTPATPVISVDRARAGIPLGTSLTITVSGPNGPLTVQVPFDGLDASFGREPKR